MECGEPLVMIAEQFIPNAEHPYIKLGAPYPEGFSPYMLRETPAQALILAQDYLLAECRKAGLPPMFIKIHDALRPNEVQKFMTERDARRRAPQFGLDPRNLSRPQMAFLIQKGLHWAAPSLDPAKPAPHTTGGTFDCYFVYENGDVVDMGTKVDSVDKRRAPMDAFNNARTQENQLIDLRRMVVKAAFFRAGFVHNPFEHYHFDHMLTQRGAYLMKLWDKNPEGIARYGRADLLPVPVAEARRAYG